MFKKVKIVMLPTNKEATIGDIIPVMKNTITIANCEPIKLKARHLYILSDDEINGGDWYYDTRDRLVSNSSLGVTQFSEKVIATTDISLNMKYDGKSSISENWDKKLPQPSQTFIEKYIQRYNEGNPIEEVMVEYEYNIDQHPDWIPSYNNPDDPPTISWDSPKIDPKTNTIIIKNMKDTWTRDEVIALIKLNTERLTNSWISSDIDWINENL